MKTRALEVYGRLPLSFEANRGQTSAPVDFISRGSGYTLSVTATEAVLALQSPNTSPPKARVVRLQLVGANDAAKPDGRNELPGKVNYFIGNDPKRWRTGVPTYAQVRYDDVYAGIDLVYYGNQRELEYDFIVAPGANPDTIAFTFDGADALEVDGAGNLVLHAGEARLLQRAPTVYQEIDGVRKQVPGRYALEGTATDPRVRFAVGGYDRRQPLVIDPVLAYSTYLGGARDDSGAGIAIDGDGSVYVTGSTRSTDFPAPAGMFDTTLGGSDDAFVTKLDASGALIYSTYLGGSSRDTGAGIAVDAAGNAYVTGSTVSADFPTTPGAFDLTTGFDQDAFVAKLGADGATLAYSSYLGGGASEWGFGIAVDDGGSAYVTGMTNSNDFPTTPGAFDTTFGDFTGLAAFVTKINPGGTALLYSTYLGGGGPATDGTADNSGFAIAVDAIGNAYVTGYTESGVFPTTIGALDATLGGDSDGFVTKLDAIGGSLIYSSYLGGNGVDVGSAIAVDDSGNAFVTGLTLSVDFPTTPGAFDTTYTAGHEDGFVTKLDAGGGLSYSTLFGGGHNDNPSGIAIDSDGNAYVTGYTQSDDFPTTPGALDTTLGGPRGGFEVPRDGFVITFNSSGTGLGYSSFLGGDGDDWGFGIALDSARNIHVTGFTSSRRFSITPGAFDPTFGSGDVFRTDAFVVKIAPEPDVDLTETALSSPPAVVVLLEEFSVTDTVENQGSTPAAKSRSSYYFSLDTLKTADDMRVTGDRKVPTLGASGTSTGLVGLTVGPAIKVGVYYLLACADATNIESESDEGNNCLASTTTVDVRAPDLVETAVSNPPAMRLRGQSFSVTDTLGNVGNAESGASTTLYYLSPHVKKHSSDPQLTGSRNAPGLGVGAHSTDAVTVTIPVNVTPGSYYVLACGDGLKAVAESDEADNCKASATKVSVQ